MNLDEVAASFRAKSDTPVIQRLGDLLLEWKEDDSTVTELDNRVEHYLGNTWIGEQPTFEEVRGTWGRFRAEAVDRIGGMTVNERLYWFGLFPRYESCATLEEKDVVYSKLLATR